MDINIGLKDAFILSISCILIVFIVLMIISLGLNLTKIIFYKRKEFSGIDNSKQVVTSVDKDGQIKFEDIKDEDMLVAAFVASIDAVGDNDNKTVRIKSIKKL